MIFEPKKWAKPTPDEMVGFMKRPKPQVWELSGSLLVFRKYLSQLTVYKFLVARFGPPHTQWVARQDAN